MTSMPLPAHTVHTCMYGPTGQKCSHTYVRVNLPGVLVANFTLLACLVEHALLAKIYAKYLRERWFMVKAYMYIKQP